MKPAPPKPIRFADLGPRLLSSLGLAAIAFIDVWLGGTWVVILVALALVLMLWEWHRMVTGDARVRAPGFVVLGIAGAAGVTATAVLGLWAGALCVGLGAGLAFAAARPAAPWLAGGLCYMGLAMCALVVLRFSEPAGLWIILWLVIVVVAGDVGAYFVGRRVGGPRLWPRVSPGKTWSGALGGLAVAAAASLLVGIWVGWTLSVTLALGVGVGIASQLGDLLESAVKRRFDVKDASRLIPGHGGVMDRLDGIVGAVWFFGLAELAAPGVLGR